MRQYKISKYLCHLMIGIAFAFAAKFAQPQEREERRDTSQLEWPVNPELKKYGVRLKMPYAQARERMIGSGWTPDLTETKLRYKDNYRPYKEFPEIVCGEGYDAICSAPFVIGKRTHSIEVREHRGRLVVRGASE